MGDRGKIKMKKTLKNEGKEKPSETKKMWIVKTTIIGEMKDDDEEVKSVGESEQKGRA